MARKRPQYYLADLVAIVAICGLVLGLFQSFASPVNVVGIIVLIGFVTNAWLTPKLLRNMPTCDECGRRFHPQNFHRQPRKQTSPSVCPHCGQPQLRSARSRKVLAISFWVSFVLAVLMIVAVPIGVGSTGSPALFRSPYFAYFRALMIGMMLLCGLFIVLLIAQFIIWFTRFKAVPCEKCGRIIPRGGMTAPLICPICRMRHLPSQQAKSEKTKSVLILLTALSLAAVFWAFLLGGTEGPLFGLSDSVATGIFIAAPVLLLGAIFAVVFLRLQRYKGEPYVLKRAGKSAGEEGEVVRSGTTTVWYTGPTNPAPLLMEQMGSTRSQLGAVTGTEVGSPPFLRILCFRKRSGFEAFVEPFTMLFSMKTQNVLFVPQPYRILAICDEDILRRIREQDETARSLFCPYFMEVLPGNPLALWVQQGISKCLTAADDDLIRLNRKMLASLSRGSLLGTHLFKINNQELRKPIKGWDDHRNFEEVDQFQFESWSVFEYLGGKSAPEERRDRFRAFLADKQAKPQPAMVFERHFGFGLDHLVESWREWVQDQGTGPFTLPPPNIEEGLLNRLISLIENHKANREDRILAIRRMGSHAYVLGADALIGLMGNDDAIPSEEIVWALESISGMVYGDDPDRWRAWWNTLPTEIRERGRFAVASS
jgi:hypothetical protein